MPTELNASRTDHPMLGGFLISSGVRCCLGTRLAVWLFPSILAGQKTLRTLSEIGVTEQSEPEEHHRLSATGGLKGSSSDSSDGQGWKMAVEF